MRPAAPPSPRATHSEAVANWTRCPAWQPRPEDGNRQASEASVVCEGKVPAPAGQGVPEQDAYTDIKNYAGTSNVYAVTYPSPMTYDPGSPASLPDCTGLTNGTRQWLTGKVPELASTIISAAGQAGIHYIDVSTLFSGHDACASVPYAQGLPGSVAATVICAAAGASCFDNWFHPNQAGYAAVEKAVASKISF